MTDPSHGVPDPRYPPGSPAVPPAPGWPSPPMSAPPAGSASAAPVPPPGYPSAPGFPAPAPPAGFPPAPGASAAAPPPPGFRPGPPGPPGFRPGPPHPGYPAGPYPAPPRRSGGARWLVLSLVLVVFLCCGGLGYAGWVRPWQQMQERKEIYADLGVPSGFNGSEPTEVEATKSVTGRVAIVCEKGVCPVNLAESIHHWMADSGQRTVTIQDVARCLGSGGSSGPRCVWAWRVGDHVVKVSTFGLLPRPGPRAYDGTFALDVEVRPADD
ncbi:hypothetical protein [Micromonospora psammae]|uniref:hypothetical protein n=1 Tax=Micromonospora sp. CPCC 205556 TaxID=3122398 RepID=UPI002FF43DE9